MSLLGRPLRPRMTAFIVSTCLALACAGSAVASFQPAGVLRQEILTGKVSPEITSLADATGQFLDPAGDVNIAGSFYKSGDIVGTEIGFFDAEVGRVDDDTFGIFTLVDSMPAVGVTSQLFAGDRLWWWLNTDNNTATGAPVGGQPAGVEVRVLIKGVSNGAPSLATYAIWNGTTSTFGPETEVPVVQLRSEFGWIISTASLGVQRGRPVGIIVESDNTGVIADGDSDFSPDGLPAFSFTPPGPPPAPVVANGDATSVSATGLTVNGTITPGGSQTTWFVRYGVGSVNEARTPDQSAGQGTAATGVSATLSGLRPSTAYQYQVVAKNPWGETAGAIKSTSTALPSIQSLPVATTQAREVQTDRLTLTGTVDPQGRPLSAYFEWGKTSKYGKRTPKTEIAAGRFGLTSITGLVRNLAPNSRLHYRLVIEGDATTSAGQDLTVETAVPDRLVIVGDPDGSCRNGSCILKRFSIQVSLRDGDTNRVRSAGKLRGVTARVRCTSVCSVNTRFLLKKGRVLRAEIGRLFGGRSLASGATIEVRITGPGLTGALYRASFVNDNLIQRTCELRGSRAAACARV